jgi:hypothetical protein
LKPDPEEVKDYMPKNEADWIGYENIFEISWENYRKSGINPYLDFKYNDYIYQKEYFYWPVEYVECPPMELILGKDMLYEDKLYYEQLDFNVDFLTYRNHQYPASMYELDIDINKYFYSMPGLEDSKKVKADFNIAIIKENYFNHLALEERETEKNNFPLHVIKKYNSRSSPKNYPHADLYNYEIIKLEEALLIAREDYILDIIEEIIIFSMIYNFLGNRPITEPIFDGFDLFPILTMY